MPFPFSYKQDLSKIQKIKNDQMRQTFFKRMFPAENDFDGQVVFAELHSYIKNGHERDYMKCTHYENQDRIKAGEWQKNRDYNSKVNHYMTCNTMCSNHYKSEDLFAYKNYVLDLDIHEAIDPQIRLNRINKAAQIILSGFLSEELPQPNAIVFTGRGLQIWWCVEQMSYKCTKAYQAFGHHLSQLAGKVINAGFIDPSCRTYTLSCKPMIQIDKDSTGGSGGLFRVPLTYNTRAASYGDLILLHNNRINVIDYVGRYVFPDHDQWEQKDSSDKHPKRKKTMSGRDNIPGIHYDPDGSDDQKAQYRSYAITNIARANFLFRLLDFRLQNGTYGKTGYRNTMIFVLYNCVVHTVGEEQAWEMVQKMNQMFPVPLSEKELASCIGKKRYLFKSATLLELLNVSEAELEIIDFRQYVQHAGKTDRENVRPYHLSTIDERMTVCELAYSGFSKIEIARKLNLHPDTVARILADNCIQTAAEKEAEIRKAKEKKILRAVKSGQSYKKIAKRYHISPAAITRIKQKKEQEDMEKAKAKQEKEKEKQARKEAWKQRRETAEQIKNEWNQRVIEMYRAQYPIKQIKKEMHLNTESVWTILVDAGLADPHILHTIQKVKGIRKTIRTIVKNGGGFNEVKKAFADTCYSLDWLLEITHVYLAARTRKKQIIRKEDRIQRGILAGNYIPVLDLP